MRRAACIAISLVLSTLAGVGGGLAAHEQWIAPPEAKKLVKPFPTPGEIAKKFGHFCAEWHGSAGKGDGPTVSRLPSKPPDLTSSAVQNQSDGELSWKISNGRLVMPSWNHFPETERWELVSYIRSLRT
jgi:Cytochrome C oxidase, cbb3-type, subunit III